MSPYPLITPYLHPLIPPLFCCHISSENSKIACELLLVNWANPSNVITWLDFSPLFSPYLLASCWPNLPINMHTSLGQECMFISLVRQAAYLLGHGLAMLKPNAMAYILGVQRIGILKSIVPYACFPWHLALWASRPAPLHIRFQH